MRVKLTEALRYNAFFIFDVVGFIDDNVLPLPFLERPHADSYSFKRGETDLKLSRLDNIAYDFFTLALSTDEVTELDLR